MSRGIDLISVSCVVNFDLPVTSRVHRVTRTSYAGISIVGALVSMKNDKNVQGGSRRSGRGGKEWTLERWVEGVEDMLYSVAKRAGQTESTSSGTTCWRLFGIIHRYQTQQ